MAIMAESEDQGPVLFPEQVVNGLPTIYSFQSCPFCFKIRALLASRGIRYADVEVEPMEKGRARLVGMERSSRIC